MSSNHHTQVLSLIALWETELERGNHITPEALCQDHPELLEEVKTQLARRKTIQNTDVTRSFTEKPTSVMTLYGNDADEPIALPNIPNYRTEAVLGRGGMGVVYRAVQVLLNRPVALKMILSGEHASSDERLRFLGEAETIAKLHHPGVVQIYDFGTHGEHPYFAMEYLPDGTLDKKLAGSPLPPNEAAVLVKKLAEALQAAHDLGIVHRDLKPANILLTPAGEPKITDFGLAKTCGSNLTATGKVMGTPSYMSPEQAEGKKDVGPATDIYALGAILYECLVGRPPFKAATPLDTILQVLSDEPVSLRQLQAKTPIDLETICHKCLQKEPGKRYGSAKKLAEDLGKYLRGETIAARPVGRVEKVWRWCKRYPAVAALVLVSVLAALVASGLAWWALESEDKANTSAQFAAKQTTEALEQKKKAEEENRTSRRLLGISRVERGLSEWRNGDQQAALLWFIEQAVVDPDSERADRATRYRLANHRRHSAIPIIKQMKVFDSRIDSAVFNPDGQNFVYCGNQPEIVESNTGRLITSIQGVDSGLGHAVYSHIGNKVVICGWGQAQLFDSKSGQAIGKPLPCKHNVTHAEFSKDDRFLLIVSSNVVIWDLATSRPVFEPAELKDRISCASLSSDDKFLVSGGQDGTVRLWDVISGKQTCPPFKVQYLSRAIFSPDKKSLLTVGYEAIQVWSTSTGQAVGSKLRHQSTVSRAVFTPDGMKIVSASEDGSLNIWDVATGKQLVAPVLHSKWITTLDISQDGRLVATGSADGSACVREALTGKPLLPLFWHPHSVNHVCFSPDGSRLLSTSGDFFTKRGEVRVWNAVLEVQKVSRKTTNYGSIAFSDDGRQVGAVKSGISQSGQIDLLDAAAPTTSHTQLRQQGWINHLSFSPDGKLFVSSHGKYGEPGDARIWTVTSGDSPIHKLAHKGKVNHASFSRDGKYVLSTSDDRTVSVWDASTGKRHLSPVEHFREVNHASFSPNGKFVISASGKAASKGNVFLRPDSIIGFEGRERPRSQIWDISSESSFTPLGSTNDDDGYCFADFSHNSMIAVTCSVRNHAQLWHVITGKPVCPPLQHQGEVCRAEFSPDDTLIVTASGDRSARIWNTATGALTTPPLQHQEYVTSARFSHHGHCIATASADRTARLWDAYTGQPLSPPLVHDDAVISISFSPDDKYLLTGTKYGVKRWDISPDNRPLKDLLHSVQYQAVSILDQVGTRIPLESNSDLVSKFSELKAKYPADFSVTPQQARAWREDQIAQCMKEGNLPAALFHQNWLLAEAVLEASKQKK